MWCSPQSFHSRLCLSSKICHGVKRPSLYQILEFSLRCLARGCHHKVFNTGDENRKIVKENLKLKTKVIKVALIGRPNVGKSTLVNQIVGRTACAVSMKAHTTRLKVKAYVNNDDTQIIFLDTPGLVSTAEVKQFRFDPKFLRSAEEAIQEADIMGIVHDVTSYRSSQLDSLTARLLFLYQQKASFLILNKVDALKKRSNLLNLVQALTKKHHSPIADSSNLTEKEIMDYSNKIRSWPQFAEVFMISALDGDGVGDVKEYLLRQALPGSWVVKGNERAFNPEVLAVDLVKAACLDYLPDEIPYRIQCKLNYFEEYEERCGVEVTVLTANRRHNRMVLDKVRPIAAYAEAQLASALEKECRLRIGIRSVEDEG